MERVLGNRNLTNKLWNAGKFLQMQMAACSGAELEALAAADFSSAQSLEGLPLVERWILSALHQVCPCPMLKPPLQSMVWVKTNRFGMPVQ